MKHMPASYALLFYLQAKKLSENLTVLRNAIGVSGDQSSVVEQIHSVFAAARFDKGKIRNVLFVGVPKAQSEQKLTRSSLSPGTSETFLYLAILLNPDRLAGIGQAGLPLGNWLQKVFHATPPAAFPAQDLKPAFDLQLAS